MSNYRAEALTWENDSDLLDRMGWDMVCEGVSETCITLDDYREAWKHYQRQYVAAVGDDRRFYAWCMVYVESCVKRMFG